MSMSYDIEDYTKLATAITPREAQLLKEVEELLAALRRMVAEYGRQDEAALDQAEAAISNAEARWERTP